MKLGIMQPYLFPYLGYFQLINLVDKWIVFDDVQYIKHGWINRNRILHPKEGWQYFIVPLKKHKFTTLIKDIEIDNSIQWKKKIIDQLQHYQKKAPYYKESIDLISMCFDINTDSIVDLNVKCLRILCEYLDINFIFKISSQCNFDYSNVKDAGEWALRISEELDAKEYINPIGGKDIFDKSKFDKSNIKLSFIKMNDFIYNQKRRSFEPSLSIIDLLMFNSKEKIKKLLNEYELV